MRSQLKLLFGEISNVYSYDHLESHKCQIIIASRDYKKILGKKLLLVSNLYVQLRPQPIRETGFLSTNKFSAPRSSSV